MADDDKRKKVGSVDFDQVRDRARQAFEHWNPVHKEAESDIQFLAGKQWDSRDAATRAAGDRITLTINDLGQYTDRVIGDLRQNPTSINIIPADVIAKDNKFISESKREYEGSEFIGGLVRQIEYKCSARDHYVMAGQHAVESGLGWLRLYSDWSDMNTFNQDIRVERIKNRHAVFSDPMATEPDTSDKNWCFIGDWMNRKEFDRKYEGKNSAPVMDVNNASLTGMTAYWTQEGQVRVTEYYWREPYSFQIAQLDNGQIITDGGDSITDEAKEDAERLWELAKAGKRILRERTHHSFKVMWAKLTYHETLEGPFRLPGTVIPVAPVVGKRIEGDTDTKYYGIIRFAKEPKRMENFWLSAATERIGQMPKAPWLISAKMIEGYENEWLNANVGLKPYLPYNADPLSPGAAPQRQMPPTIPAGELQMMFNMREIVKGSVGLHDAAVGKTTNQQSGIALSRLENAANVGSFVFTDNLRIAVSLIGRCILEWLPEIYDAERVVTIRHENGEVDTVKLNLVMPDGSLQNDIRAGVFDQHVTTGPAYATLRQQASETTLQFFQMVPDAVPAMFDIALSNMDWPGAQQMAKRARKMVPKQLLDETELTEEEKNAPPEPPTPMDEIAMAELEAKGKTAEATMAKAEATIVDAQTDIQLSEHKLQMAAVQTEQAMVEAAAPQPAPAPAPAAQPQADGGAVTMAAFEAFKNDLAQVLGPLVQMLQTMKGPTNG